MATTKGTDIRLLKRLLQQAAPYRLHIISILFLDLLATPLALLTPLPLKVVVDSVIGTDPLPGFLSSLLPSSIQGSTTPLLVFAVALLVAVALLTQFHSLGTSFLRTYTGQKLALDFRARLFRHGQRLSLAYHDTKGASDTLYRVQYDTVSLQSVTIDGLIPMVAAVVTLVSMIYVTARISTQLAVVALLVTPVLVLLIKAYRQPLRNRWRQQKRLDSSAMSVINEVFSALRVVKAFTQEDREQERYTQRATESLAARLRVTLLQGSFGLASGATIAIGTGVVLFLGVRSIQAGAMTVGDLLIVMAYLGMLYGPLKTIGKRLASLQNAFASAERAFSFLDEAVDVPEKTNAIPLRQSKGEFKLFDVAFGYNPNQLVLHDVSLEIPPGTKVGIAGRTGAGKTTLLSLLMRFYDPTSGQILLDGVDLRDYKLMDLRRQYSIVLQEPVLFSTSIAENIAYARPEAGEEDVISAARAAHAHDFIVELTDGYETLVGERGMRLSGGERQRIALARAFLRDAPILLLDEPTSSVDIKTEAIIMEIMERLMHGRTTFMIAHRLSTLDNCDLLLEVKDGHVVHATNSFFHASAAHL